MNEKLWFFREKEKNGSVRIGFRLVKVRSISVDPELYLASVILDTYIGMYGSVGKKLD